MAGPYEANPAKVLFERLRADGWAVVEEWVANRETETNVLEFKRKDTPSTPLVEPGDKANIASTLSALANTESGLLVIGIDAGGAGGGQDRVRRVESITEVEKFAGAIGKPLRVFTEPYISGLDLQAVEDPSKPGFGIVAVYVPHSEGGPHRATNATKEVNERYYMRTAAGVQTMPHTLLAALFGRAPHPDLELRVRISQKHPITVEFRLVNHGRGMARRPQVMVVAPPPLLNWHMLGSGFSLSRSWQGLDGRRRILLDGDSDFVLHPEADCVVGYPHLMGNDVPPEGVEFRFDVVVYADGTQPIEGTAVVTFGNHDLDEEVFARVESIRRHVG